MKIKKTLFSAKLLLFGEYVVMGSAKGLSMPHGFYKGALKFKSNSKIFSSLSNKILKIYASFLEELQKSCDFPARLNLPSIRRDLEIGMYFDSNIPQGYGIGSSGALVAAFYESYAYNPISPKKAIEKEYTLVLKKIFSMMESYFHGKSSGIDPLICYLNLPLLIHSHNNISTVGIPNTKKGEGEGAIFLINSGISSTTSSMVQVFFQKLKNYGFRKTLREEFIKYNNTCIETFLNGTFQILLKNMKSLSSWVLQNLHPMIPLSLREIWSEGIQTNDYYLKLCGSGGGGFILGFTRNYNLAKEKLKNYHPEIIFRF